MKVKIKHKDSGQVYECPKANVKSFIDGGSWEYVEKPKPKKKPTTNK